MPLQMRRARKKQKQMVQGHMQMLRARKKKQKQLRARQRLEKQMEQGQTQMQEMDPWEEEQLVDQFFEELFKQHEKDLGEAQDERETMDQMFLMWQQRCQQELL